MSLDGLRAWIGEVERKLGIRTRVFIVLLAIAVGGAGAAIYLAIDAQDNAVSKADLQAVRDELATSSGEAGGGETAQLEAELKALQSEVAALRSEEAPKGKSGSSEPGGEVESGAGGATVPKTQKQLKELIEQAEEQAGK